ncbi:MAG: DUF2232 domain-containing protein [Spirochaetes bacterium]|nr:DUF2232 domain-containing protein [Spirochaetota bacterium]
MELSALVRQPRFLLTLGVCFALSLLGLQFNVAAAFLLAYNLREVYTVGASAAALVGAAYAVLHLAVCPYFLTKTTPLGVLATYQMVLAAPLALLVGWWILPRVRSYFGWVAVAGAVVLGCDAIAWAYGKSFLGLDLWTALPGQAKSLFESTLQQSGRLKPDDAKAALDVFKLSTDYFWALRVMDAWVMFYACSVIYLRLFHPDRFPESSRLRYLQTPRLLMAPVIAAWAVVLFAHWQPALAAWRPLAVHVLLLCGFIYLFQGAGVVSHFFHRLGRGPWPLWVVLGLVLLAGAFAPAVWLVVLTALLGFGLFDPWLNYRRL